MIKSMTGFGHGESQKDGRHFTVEMKSVNHRYFDVNIRMPKTLGFFEASIRDTLKKHIHRGKVDVFITYENLSDTNVNVRYNPSIAAEYVRYYKELAEQFGLDSDIRASTIGRCPEVFTLEETTEDNDQLWSILESALLDACTSFVKTREIEGEALKKDILEKLDEMRRGIERIEERYPEIIEAYTKRLRDKLSEVLSDQQLDEQRLAAELVIFSDKLCTDEETVRLKSHIETMARELGQGNDVGRKLDFIAQEMNREANTILSKANDLETSNIAIDLKTGIEKIREQIQNIE